jgi:hypothetical protein
MVFLEGTASAVPKKNSVVLEHDPPVEAKTIANGERRVANGFSGGHGFCRAEKIRSCWSTTLQLKSKR